MKALGHQAGLKAFGRAIKFLFNPKNTFSINGLNFVMEKEEQETEFDCY